MSFISCHYLAICFYQTLIISRPLSKLKITAIQLHYLSVNETSFLSLSAAHAACHIPLQLMLQNVTNYAR